MAKHIIFKLKQKSGFAVDINLEGFVDDELVSLDSGVRIIPNGSIAWTKPTSVGSILKDFNDYTNRNKNHGLGYEISYRVGDGE